MTSNLSKQYAKKKQHSDGVLSKVIGMNNM